MGNNSVHCINGNEIIFAMQPQVHSEEILG
jgi:hypothetical protein